MGDKWVVITWTLSVHSLIHTKPKPVTPTHTHTHTHSVQLKNPRKSYLRWLLNLLLLSVEFHVLERNNELRQFLILCNRQQSRADWYSYNLFSDQNLLHCKGDVTRWMYTVCYRNVTRYCGAYRLNGIPTNFQNYSIYATIHCLCYRHKQAQIAQKTCIYWYQLCKYKSIGGSYLEITTGQDSVWSDTPLVEPVFKGYTV
jgi:hypothetical protein